MADDIREFKNATIEVAGAKTEPMTVTVAVETKDGKRSGSGEAQVSQTVFDEIEGVEGQATVHTASGETFTIMIRKAFKDTRRIEFQTSGPVPESGA
ncbi:hypothetical protein ACSQ76_10055 [Roseovarius sp. B08]|uniref:hypothetical protein n=1 Tax=Roseovarius sp. B08 TaxID=3449223 RepID=UPI003EDBE809